jgi:hypothetical protein
MGQGPLTVVLGRRGLQGELLPAVRRFKSPDGRIALYEAVEKRFAAQARMTTLLGWRSGASGLM